MLLSLKKLVFKFYILQSAFGVDYLHLQTVGYVRNPTAAQTAQTFINI